MDLKDIIRTNVEASLKDTIKIVRLKASQSINQLSGSYSKLMKTIKKLRAKLPLLEKEVEALEMIAITITANSKYVDITKQLSILDSIQEEIDGLTDAKVRLQSISKKNSEPSLVAINEDLKKAKKLYERASNKLSDLAEQRSPKILKIIKETEIGEIVSSIRNTIKQFNLKNDAEVEFVKNESKFVVDKIKVGQIDAIRFARFIPLRNIPLVNEEDGEKDLYIVFCTDLRLSKNPENQTIFLKNMLLYITLTDTITRPSKISFFPCKNKEVMKILNVLADKYSIALFGDYIKGSMEARLKTLIEQKKLNVLQDNDVEVKKDQQFIYITVPKKDSKHPHGYRKLLKTDNTLNLERDFEIDLFKDVSKLLNFNNKTAAGGANGRIKLISIKKNSDNSITIKYRKSSSTIKDIKVYDPRKSDIADRGENPDYQKFLNNSEIDDLDFVKAIQEQAKHIRFED